MFSIAKMGEAPYCCPGAPGIPVQMCCCRGEEYILAPQLQTILWLNSHCLAAVQLLLHQGMHREEEWRVQEDPSPRPLCMWLEKAILCGQSRCLSW